MSLVLAPLVEAPGFSRGQRATLHLQGFLIQKFRALRASVVNDFRYTCAFTRDANFSRTFFTLGATVNMQYGWKGWFLK
jgi:hypothetical protein